jgi:hypothetical protein
VKERPILFSGDMVRAILSGSKTQTRRIAKPRRGDRTPCEHWMPYTSDVIGRNCEHGSEVQFCPDGQPGDRLWVRETFGIGRYEADGESIEGRAHYRSSEPSCKCRWLPSIHMPRWASRITLEITDVRVERLQTISGQDCWAEGIEAAGWDCTRYGSVVECYRDIWESIHGVGAWDINPLVWVVKFKRVEVGGK